MFAGNFKSVPAYGLECGRVARESSIMIDHPGTVPNPPRLRLRILFGEDAMLGPGKAELLDGIRDCGSIAAAGRRMNMSYKRAWMLVEQMNSAFAKPLVDSARGGQGGGGAHLTDTGIEVLRLYRAVEDTAARSAEADIAALRALLRPVGGNDMSDGK